MHDLSIRVINEQKISIVYSMFCVFEKDAGSIDGICILRPKCLTYCSTGKVTVDPEFGSFERIQNH